MNLWEDHQRRVHIFGDWTAVNIIAWSIIMAIIIGGAFGLGWLISLLPLGARIGC